MDSDGADLSKHHAPSVVWSCNTLDRLREEQVETKRILVVDDNQASRDLVRSALDDESYVIDEASDGREALDLIRDLKPDLVLMDIQMPIMDGYSALTEIRKSQSTLPIIAITAYAVMDDRNRAIRAGFDAYLAKPLNVITLRLQVAQLLRRDGQ